MTNQGVYEGCSLILVIDSISPKPESVPEQKDSIIIDGFFAILKSPNNFRTVQFIIANRDSEEGHPYDTANTFLTLSQ